MRITRIIVLFFILITLTIVVTSCKLFTIVKHDDLNNNGSGKNGNSINNKFDAEQYISSIWDSKIIPYMNENADDLTAVLNEIEKDKEKACKEYGLNCKGDKCNFIVKGEGKVSEVNKKSQNGILEVDVEKYNIKIQIGPAISGSTIRDSMEFIKFGNFKNQIEFGEISNVLNDRIYENIIKNLDIKDSKNKSISFIGAFTYIGIEKEEIVITPIELEILKEKE